jgi:hypothetical protein
MDRHRNRKEKGMSGAPDRIWVLPPVWKVSPVSGTYFFEPVDAAELVEYVRAYPESDRRPDMTEKWIGVDLDGTLAEKSEEYDWRKIGPPIAPMVKRVNDWLAEGRDVRIFTARMAGWGQEPAEARQQIQNWLAKEAHLPRLAVTNAKDPDMIELWDDRCVQVQPNAGVPVHEFWRHTL